MMHFAFLNLNFRNYFADYHCYYYYWLILLVPMQVTVFLIFPLFYPNS